MYGMEDVIEGDIIWANGVPPQYGFERKDRRVVVVGLYSGFLLAVGISTQIPEDDTQLDFYCVLLPFAASGHPRTSLTHRCAAVSNWAVRVFEQWTALPGACKFERWAGALTDEEFDKLIDLVRHAYDAKCMVPFQPDGLPNG